MTGADRVRSLSRDSSRCVIFAVIVHQHRCHASLASVVPHFVAVAVCRGRGVRGVSQFCRRASKRSAWCLFRLSRRRHVSRVLLCCGFVRVGADVSKRCRPVVVEVARRAGQGGWWRARRCAGIGQQRCCRVGWRSRSGTAGAVGCRWRVGSCDA